MFKLFLIEIKNLKNFVNSKLGRLEIFYEDLGKFFIRKLKKNKENIRKKNKFLSSSSRETKNIFKK